jgi:hypothetical protein
MLDTAIAEARGMLALKFDRKKRFKLATATVDQSF